MDDEKIKRYIDLLSESNRIDDELDRLEYNIMLDMEKEGIKEYTFDNKMLKHIKYSRYINWDIEKLQDILNSDFKKYVKEKKKYSVDTDKLKKDSILWDKIKQYAEKQDIEFLDIDNEV